MAEEEERPLWRRQRETEEEEEEEEEAEDEDLVALEMYEQECARLLRLQQGEQEGASRRAAAALG